MNRIGVLGMTPFLTCVRHCREARFFKLLVERGALRSAKDDAGNTALHIAASAGNEAGIKYLVDAGINANARREQDDQTPIMAAAKSNKPNTQSRVQRFAFSKHR